MWTDYTHHHQDCEYYIVGPCFFVFSVNLGYIYHQR